MNSELDELRNRIGRLERQRRRTRAGVMMAASLAGLCFLAGQSKPSGDNAEQDAQSIVLRDAKGRPRISLRADSDNPFIAILDEHGHAELALVSDQKRVAIVMSRGGGKSDNKVIVGAYSEGGMLSLFDPTHERLTLIGRAEGSGVYVRDGKGINRQVMQCDNESVNFAISDNDGNVRACLGTNYLERSKTGDRTTTSESAIVLYDQKAKVLWKAP